MTKQEITNALLAEEPPYQQLVTRVTDPDILFTIYSETENNNLKNRIISLLFMQSHPELSSFLVQAFAEGDLSIKITVVANLSSLAEPILKDQKLKSVLTEALKLDDVNLQKFAIKLIKSRNLPHYESTLDRISKHSSNEYIRSLINND